VLQRIQYGKDYKPEVVTVPGKGSTKFEYDNAFRLERIIQFDRVSHTGRYEKNDLIRMIHSLVSVESEETYNQGFSYDELERLSGKWNNVYSSSKVEPLVRLFYQYASLEQPGCIKSDSKLLDSGAGIWRTVYDFQSSNGNPIGKAIKNDTSWVVKDIRYTSSERGVSKLYSDVIPSFEPQNLDFSKFLGMSARLEDDERSILDIPIISKRIYQKDRTGVFETHADVLQGELQVRTTENGRFAIAETRNSEGLRTSFRDQVGNDYFFEYDALGRLIKVIMPGSDPQKVIHQVRYDVLGRIKEVDRTHIEKISFNYLLGTELVESKSFLGTDSVLIRTENYKYDSAGRVIEQVQTIPSKSLLSLSESRRFEFFYDGKLPSGETLPDQLGRLTAIRAPEFSKTFRYQKDGRLEKGELHIPNWKSVSQSIEYQPDGTTRRKITEYRNNPHVLIEKGVKVTQEFETDSIGRLGELRINVAPVAKFQYDPYSTLNKIEFQNGDHFSFGFDKITQRMRTFGGSKGGYKFGNAWKLSDRGLIEEERFMFSNQSLNRVYGYTDHKLLSKDSDEKGQTEYNYDSSGMLKQTTGQSGEQKIISNEGKWLLLNGSSQLNYNVDRLGRLASKPNTKLIYGPSGRVERIQRKEKSDVTYVYDEEGKRVFKKIGEDFIEGYFGNIVFTGDTIFQPIGLGGTALGILENDQFKVLPTDFRGSVLTAQNETSASFVSPYGERKEGRGAYSTTIDYVSQGYDPDLQAYRMDHRDYDPKLKRFLTPDPLFFENPHRCLESPIECNVYGYAAGNPVSFVDPLGLSSGFPSGSQIFFGGIAENFSSMVDRTATNVMAAYSAAAALFVPGVAQGAALGGFAGGTVGALQSYADGTSVKAGALEGAKVGVVGGAAGGGAGYLAVSALGYAGTGSIVSNVFAGVAGSTAATYAGIGYGEGRLPTGTELGFGIALGGTAGLVSGALAIPSLTSGYSSRITAVTDNLMQSVKSIGGSFSLTPHQERGK
jgi:RHS repeat-associated protein